MVSYKGSRLTLVFLDLSCVHVATWLAELCPTRGMQYAFQLVNVSFKFMQWFKETCDKLTFILKSKIVPITYTAYVFFIIWSEILIKFWFVFYWRDIVLVWESEL